MSLPQSGGYAIVTGAGSGIGRAFSTALDRNGCSVILAGRGEAALQRLAAGLRLCAGVVAADLATDAGLAAVAAACPDRLDVLVHSAGVFHSGPVHRMGCPDWDGLYAVNLRAPMLLTTLCLPALRAASGQIVFVNSTAALQAGKDNAAYAAIKQALKAAADALRQELRGSSVRVLSIFPGRTETAMQRLVLASEGRPDAVIPMLDAAEVADAALATLGTPRHAEITDLVIRPRNE